MTNEKLVSELSEQLGWTQNRVSETLAKTVKQITAILVEGATISITDLGTLKTEKRSEHIYVDPETEQRYLVPPQISVHFIPFSSFKEKYK
ncbi:MAG TPA: HU family DNA-binding protein [Dysgonamonadaceae bacterium]|nr:HU family DNA-binding protein [Dysgonamonadaceae bacterium]